MCTVSIISLGGASAGYRLVTNRDEQRSRAPAIEPVWHEVGSGGARTRVIAPRDPVGGGTWVATTEQGLTLCLLNGNLEPAPELPRVLRSRGELIPALVGLGGVRRVAEALAEMDLASFAPFRLVGVQPSSADEPAGVGERRAGDSSALVIDLFWDRRLLGARIHERLPLCFVSSGLGDSRVQPRLPLFDELVGRDPTPALQDAYHAHVWPDRPEISVRMSRSDARTVSTTVIVVRRTAGGTTDVRAAYTPISDPS